jgi:hypothetical protein
VLFVVASSHSSRFYFSLTSVFEICNYFMFLQIDGDLAVGKMSPLVLSLALAPIHVPLENV